MPNESGSVVKARVSSEYLDSQRSLHASKLSTASVSVAINGDRVEESIGAEIKRVLTMADIRVMSVLGDVTKHCEIDLSAFDSLIICSGALHSNWFEYADIDEVRRVIDVNLFGPYRLAQKFVRDTIDSAARKKIIFMGSTAHDHVLNGSAVYCASKAGLSMLSKCLAFELAPKGFDVFCVNPSNVASASMSEETIRELMRYKNLDRKTAEQYWSAGNQREEFLSKREIADVVAALLSGRHPWLSGANLDLAGGNR